jgi:hypothetical protein
MHAKNEAQITKLSEEVEKLKEESGAVQVQQTQTQAPDHSAELNDLKLQKRDACVTVSAILDRIHIGGACLHWGKGRGSALRRGSAS